MHEASLFARRLREWRGKSGQTGRVTQEQLAVRLGVSVDAIGKYERSISYIRGDLEPRLVDQLGWTRDEVTACREDWMTRQGKTGGARYRLLSQAVVDQVYGGSWRNAALASLELAKEQFGNLPEGLEPDIDVWLPLYETFHDLWSAVLKGDALVAKWGMMILLPEDETRFREGRLEETDMKVSRVRPTLIPGTYFGYCPVLIVKPGEEGAASLLLSSFVSFLERLASRGVVFHGIGTVSVSPAGAQVCRDLGMISIGVHAIDREYELWELPGYAMAETVFGRKSSLIAGSYRDAFPIDP